MRKVSISKLKNDIITVCHQMSRKGFVAATDGNVSAKIHEDKFIITPTSFNKGFLKAEDLIIINSDGKILEGNHKVTSEYLMHMEAYKLRPDIGAVVHAHPPLLTAFSIAELEIPEDMLPEVVLTIGQIPTTQYATPSTQEGAIVIKDLIIKHDAITLKRHGSLTVGKDIYSAYNKLEKIEHAAQIALTVKSLGGSHSLTDDQLEKLTYMAHKLGIRKDL